MRQASADGNVEKTRAQNMRQLLLRASRIVNRHVVEGLQARGYAELRSTHTTLLSNMSLAGGSVSQAAERAGISKQAMGRLALDLESAGYLRVISDSKDARVRKLELTETGQRLMLDSLNVMADLERRYAKLIGPDTLRATLDGLKAFSDAAD
jgi:DNA-binding MarR family transcriptional regulator